MGIKSWTDPDTGEIVYFDDTTDTPVPVAPSLGGVFSGNGPLSGLFGGGTPAPVVPTPWKRGDEKVGSAPNGEPVYEVFRKVGDQFERKYVTGAGAPFTFKEPPSKPQLVELPNGRLVSVRLGPDGNLITNVIEQGGDTAAQRQSANAASANAATAYQSMILQDQRKREELQQAEVSEAFKRATTTYNIERANDKEAYARSVDNVKLHNEAITQLFNQQNALSTIDMRIAEIGEARNNLNIQAQNAAAQFNQTMGFDVARSNQQAAEARETRLQSLAGTIAETARDPGDRAKLASFMLANSGWGKDIPVGADMRTTESLAPLESLLRTRQDVQNRPSQPYSFTPYTPVTAGVLDTSGIRRPVIAAPTQTVPYPITQAPKFDPSIAPTVPVAPAAGVTPAVVAPLAAPKFDYPTRPAAEHIPEVVGPRGQFMDMAPFNEMAHGGMTEEPMFIVGDSRSGRPTGYEEVIMNPTRAPLSVIPNRSLPRYGDGTTNVPVPAMPPGMPTSGGIGNTGARNPLEAYMWLRNQGVDHQQAADMSLAIMNSDEALRNNTAAAAQQAAPAAPPSPAYTPPFKSYRPGSQFDDVDNAPNVDFFSTSMDLDPAHGAARDPWRPPISGVDTPRAPLDRLSPGTTPWGAIKALYNYGPSAGMTDVEMSRSNNEALSSILGGALMYPGVGSGVGSAIQGTPRYLEGLMQQAAGAAPPMPPGLSPIDVGYGVWKANKVAEAAEAKAVDAFRRWYYGMLGPNNPARLAADELLRTGSAAARTWRPEVPYNVMSSVAQGLGLPGYAEGTGYLPRYAQGTSAVSDLNYKYYDPDLPLDPSDVIRGTYVLSDNGQRLLDHARDSRLWSNNYGNNQVMPPVGGKYMGKYDDTQSRWLNGSPFDDLDGTLLPKEYEGRGTITVPRFPLSRTPGQDAGAGVTYPDAVIPHEFVHYAGDLNTIDYSQFNRILGKELREPRAGEMLANFLRTQNPFAKDVGVEDLPVLRDDPDYPYADPWHPYVNVADAFKGRAYDMPESLRPFYPWLAQEQPDVLSPNRKYWDSSKMPAYAEGTGIFNQFGNVNDTDRTLAQEFLRQSSQAARSGTPWQTGPLPQPVFASSPGFSPYVSGIIGSLMAQEQGVPADYFAAQAAKYRPTGVRESVIGRSA